MNITSSVVKILLPINTCTYYIYSIFITNSDDSLNSLINLLKSATPVLIDIFTTIGICLTASSILLIGIKMVAKYKEQKERLDLIQRFPQIFIGLTLLGCLNLIAAIILKLFD